MGGGTPSFIGAERLGAVVEAIRSAFSLEPDCEITVEANPGDVTEEWLSAGRAMGVNRLSLGVQGMRDEDLRFLERRHSVAEAIAAARRAREAGFDNLGIDLIAGLPGHTAELTKEILGRAVAEFAPEHLSCYQLTCAPGTRLSEAVERGEVRLLDADEESEVFMATHETLERLGYEGYEVSNFARTPARRSRHNSAYWTHEDYVGFGPSAHSFMDPVRSWNTNSLEGYCAALERGELPSAGQEVLSDLQRAEEIILLGLRTREGFSLETLRRECGVDLLLEKRDAIDEAVSEGLLNCSADRIRPTLKGMAVADALAEELAPG
jgi:oxygen-independent coproporphyrinogen-3 oxidase